MEIAVRPDARISVRDPGAAERLLRLQRHEGRAGHLRLEVIGGPHAGYSRPDDQDIEMLGLCGGLSGGAHAVTSRCLLDVITSDSAGPRHPFDQDQDRGLPVAGLLAGPRPGGCLGQPRAAENALHRVVSFMAGILEDRSATRLERILA